MHEQSNRLRTKVEKGVYRRRTKDGQTRYEVCYLDSDGRQRWATTATLREARQLRAEVVSKVGRGERVAPSRVTLAEYADTWLGAQAGRLRPKTHELYDSYLRLHVLPRLGRRQVQSITVDDCAALIASMQEGVRYRERNGQLVKTEGKPFASWTIRAVLVVLGRVLGSATRAGLIPHNPVRKLDRGERPKVERREFPSLDRDAIGRLVACSPKKYRTLIAVSVLTGLRQAEALGLRWQDVDVKEGVLRVRVQLDRKGNLVAPKTTAARRTVPIPASLSRMLAEHRLASSHSTEGDFVFCSETGTPLGHRNIVRRGLEKAIEKAALPKLTWHDLRHVAASALIAEGASVAYVSRVLGHASPAITLNTYTHLFAAAEHADRTRERMEQAFGELLP